MGTSIEMMSQRSSGWFWLAPVALARNLGFSPVELRRVQTLGAEHEPAVAGGLE
jgi:hypothetical protein